jgi:hypothetical protein
VNAATEFLDLDQLTLQLQNAFEHKLQKNVKTTNSEHFSADLQIVTEFYIILLILMKL